MNNKFRIYNVRLKRFEKNCRFFLSNDGQILYKDADPNGVDMSGCIRIIPVKPSDYIVQRFTGTKDMNANEIFEGDIISLDEIDTSTPWTGKPRIIQHFDKAKVVWDTTSLCYYYAPIKNGVIGIIHQMLKCGYNIKIIGNILKS